MTATREPCGLCAGEPCRTPCAQCGGHAEGGLCSHHSYAPEGWAAENRLICNLIHRGVPIPRLPAAQREEPYVSAWG